MAKNHGGIGGSQTSRPASRSKPAKKSHKPAKAGPAGPAGGKLSPDAAPAKTAKFHQRSFSVAFQQRVLDVFGHALAPTLASPHLTATLQAVKKALYGRDFAAAFSQEAPPADATGLSPFDAYAARWSPTRALAYAAILGSPMVQAQLGGGGSGSGGTNTNRRRRDHLRMVALGGGAAEVVAFAAAMLTERGDTEAEADAGAGTDAHLVTEQRNAVADIQDDLVLVDAAPWADVVGRLRSTMTGSVDGMGPATRIPLVQPPSRLVVDVRQLDLLQLTDADMSLLLAPSFSPPPPQPHPSSLAPTTLITLFFTLNELFTAGGMGAAATFLLRLTAAALPGSLLLVVDSPGSYAQTTVGSQARPYPMRWILDKILTGRGDHGKESSNPDPKDSHNAPSWTKLHQEESAWFRLLPGLVYPIRLEDMRYQLHFYVRQSQQSERESAGSV